MAADSRRGRVKDDGSLLATRLQWCRVEGGVGLVGFVDAWGWTAGWQRRISSGEEWMLQAAWHWGWAEMSGAVEGTNRQRVGASAANVPSSLPLHVSGRGGSGRRICCEDGRVEAGVGLAQMIRPWGTVEMGCPLPFGVRWE